MASKKKRVYRRGMTLFHKETHQKVVFGKFNDDGSAGCITADKQFINIDREDIDTNYTAYSEVERDARERRRMQGW